MTHRDRLLAVFEKHPLDHLPWLADVTYWFDAQKARHALPARYLGEDGLALLHTDHDLCQYYGAGSSLGIAQGEGISHETIRQGDLLIERITIDGHSLERHRRWLPESCTYAISKYYVTEPGQLALVREYYARLQWTLNPAANDIFATVGEAGVPITPLPRSPLPAILNDWVGVEHAIFLMADHPEAVEQTVAAIDRFNDDWFSLLPHSQARLVHLCDNLSADTIGGYWDEWCADYYRRSVDRVHATGKYCVSHLDGATRTLIPRMAATGLDGIEALTPLPVGDIVMEEMSRLMALHDCVFWGGLPGAMFAHPYGWDDLKVQIDQLYQLYQSGRRMVIGSADQIPPDADIEIVRRVGEYIATLGG